MKIKLCIFVGGTSSEREVSLLSYKEIYKNIDKDKYDLYKIEINKENSKEWISELISIAPDIVLSALHGGKGEDGSIQGVLECLNIPYVGSKVMSSSICMDKNMSKFIMKNNLIPVADDVFIKKNDNYIIYEEKIKILEFPLIVKPNLGGSSLGIKIVNNEIDLKKHIAEIQKYDDVLVEKYIIGREVTCAIIQNKDGIKVLPVLDIKTENEFFDFHAKYENDETNIGFSALPLYQQEMIEEIAKKVFVCLDCHGYGRVDMIVFEEQIYVLEMNTLPGLTSHSLVPKAVSKEKTFKEFIDELIKFELNIDVY